MEGKDDGIEVINQLIPHDSQIYYRSQVGEIKINREGTKRRSMIFWTKIIPPHTQPNYSRSGLIEKLQKNEIGKGAIRHIAVFYNPTSRGGKGKKLTNSLQKKFNKVDGFTSEFFNTLDDEALKVEIDNCVKQSDRCIAICGGDGTVNMMLNKIKALSANDDKSIPILVIPFGTGNDFHGSLGFNTQATLDKRLSSAIRLPLDLGTVKFVDGNTHQEKTLIFTCQIGFAFSAQATILGNKLGLFGRYKYKVGAFCSIVKKKIFRYTLILDDNIVLKDTDFQIVRKLRFPGYKTIEIQNTQLVGGGLRLCPFAQLDDGLLDLLLYYPLTRKRIMDVFGNAKKNGAHVFEEDCHYYRFKKIRIEFHDPCQIQSKYCLCVK